MKEEPLLSNEVIEVQMSSGPRRLTETIQPTGIFQVLDLGADFDPIFSKKFVEPGFYPAEEVYFKSKTQRLNKFQLWLRRIPTFHPESVMLLIWQFLMVVINIFYFFYIPVKIFVIDTDESLNPNLEPDEIGFIVNFAIYALLVDISVSFNTAFHKDGKLVISRKQIALEYIKLVTIIPHYPLLLAVRIRLSRSLESDPRHRPQNRLHQNLLLSQVLLCPQIRRKNLPYAPTPQGTQSPIRSLETLSRLDLCGPCICLFLLWSRNIQL